MRAPSLVVNCVATFGFADFCYKVAPFLWAFHPIHLLTLFAAAIAAMVLVWGDFR